MTGRRDWGAVRQRKGGRWEARYKDRRGTIHYDYFRTKDEASAYLATVRTDIKRGEWVDPRLGATTLAAWADGFLDAKERKVRANTMRFYRALVRNHISPHLGDYTLATITAEDVEGWLTGLLDDGMSTTMANRAFVLLNQMLKLAVARRYITHNPCATVEAPRDVRHEALFLSPADVANLADNIPGHYATLVLMAAYSGLRWGELSGLKVKRVNVLRREVRVEEQLTLDGTFQPPKTAAGRRTVRLPAWLVDRLVPHLAGKGPEALVFTTPEGTPLVNSNFNRRVWKPAVRAALPPALHGLRFHDLRHTAVAIAIDSARRAGQPLNAKALQMRMGHSTIVMTLDRYGHLLDGHDDAMVDGMEDPFASRPTNVVAIR